MESFSVLLLAVLVLLIGLPSVHSADMASMNMTDLLYLNGTTSMGIDPYHNMTADMITTDDEDDMGDSLSMNTMDDDKDDLTIPAPNATTTTTAGDAGTTPLAENGLVDVERDAAGEEWPCCQDRKFADVLGRVRCVPRPDGETCCRVCPQERVRRRTAATTVE